MIYKQGKPYIKLQDYSVSKEEFTLISIPDLDILRTEPIPSIDRIGDYYISPSYISHQDRRHSIFEKIYQLIKKYTLSNKIKFIQKTCPSKGIMLDIGCGTGEFLVCANENGWSTIGFEPSLSAASLARNKGLKLMSSLEDVESHSVDVITMWHVLEHVIDLEEQISELKRMLKPSGILIIAVPNFKSFDAEYYKNYWAAFDVPRHIWHFSQKGIYKIFSQRGFKLIKTLPMLFDSFYVSLLSEQYKSGSKNWVKAFYIGLMSNLKAKRSSEYSSLIYVFSKEN